MRVLFLLWPLAVGMMCVAQVRTYPLENNAVLEHYVQSHPDHQWGSSVKLGKWGRTDTLQLPFFDEFNQTSIYPDSSRWLQNQVYVNTHFGWQPPSIGVATFDGLDAKGRPYNGTINKDYHGPGDSLLSQRINLGDSAGVPYVLADSIVLSFFIQANGNGYHLNGEDSIRLFFKNSFGNWIQVWSRGGQSDRTAFEHVKIPVDQSGYLHSGFQFLFTTYSRQVGNANHWNLDYVLLDKGRSLSENSYPDYSIQSMPSSLLRRYAEMPLSHFLVDPDGETADSIYIWAYNLDSVTLNIQFRHQESVQGTDLINTAFGSNNANIAAGQSRLRRTKAYSLNGALGGAIPASVDRRYYIRESGVINVNRDNDSLHTTQEFNDYFAHDDGSAEQGFGFDQNTNPSNIPGEIAYRFVLNKTDTLYALGAFFNRAVYEGATNRFRFRVWRKIGLDGSEDQLVYQSELLAPHYMEKINRFSIHYLDTLLILPAGEFYIGWRQETMFNLNIGWDRNSGYAPNPDRVSTNLYYKLFDQWRNDGLPYGELMLRPYVGSERAIYSGIRPLQKDEGLRFWPNPSSGWVQFSEEMAEIQLADLQGRILLRAQHVEQLDVSSVPNGIYLISGRNLGNRWLFSKLHIFAD